MTKREVELLTRVGPKGQIVLRKDMRRSLGIQPGSLIRMRQVGNEVRIKPLNKKALFERVEKIAHEIGKKWPKGKTSVDIIREERRY